jgi:hypothetical protein
MQAAFTLYESRPDKGWGLTDCLSIIVMEQRSSLTRPQPKDYSACSQTLPRRLNSVKYHSLDELSRQGLDEIEHFRGRLFRDWEESDEHYAADP